MLSPLHALIDAIDRFDQLASDERARFLEAMRHVSADQVDTAELLEALEAKWLPPASPNALLPDNPLLSRLFESLWAARPSHPATTSGQRFDDRIVALIARLYREFGSAHGSRHHLLRALAADGGDAAWSTFATLISTDPPADAADAALVFVPLFQRRDFDASLLFPQLAAGLAHPATAVVTLDLANYLTRTGRVPNHPFAERSEHLANLLGEFVGRLERLEEHPESFANAEGHVQLSDLVNEAVTTVVALCDALGLIGEPAAIGKLHRAMQLGHRRVRAEAAAALARLENEAGIATLAELASEPAVRSRVLHYLEELELLEKVDPKHRDEVARAAGELAAWLAEPMQFGLPPTDLEPFDHRRLAWPGYDEPVECYLFRYEYRLGGEQLASVGLVGPTTAAVRADLQDLSPADIYAMYAGADLQHPEVDVAPAEALDANEQGEWQGVRERILEWGCESVELVKRGRFFGEVHWVAVAWRQSKPGIAIVDGEEIQWHPLLGGRWPLGPDEIYHRHTGRKLMRVFNPSSTADD